MFPVSYVMIFAFHSELNLDRKTERGFGHNLQKTTLNRDTLFLADITTMRQLKNRAITVSQKRQKQAIT